MKKPLLYLSAACVAALCSGCGSLGIGGPKMDTAEATTLVQETVTKNIDRSQWKIYNIRWQEGEELGNELLQVTVGLVNPSGDCFTQSFILSGPAKGTVSELRQATGRNRVEFEKVTGIDPAMIDPAAIQKQYEAAKAMIPENYTFKSIGRYEIGETLSSGVELFDRGKNVGAIETEFDVRVTENGKEMIESAGKRSIQYYEVVFDVGPDGSVEMRE